MIGSALGTVDVRIGAVAESLSAHVYPVYWSGADGRPSSDFTTIGESDSIHTMV